MKKTIIIAFIFFSTNQAFSQLWKTYLDSAKAYSQLKETDKAIDFYTRSKGELEKDSSGTNSYAQICDSLGSLFYTERKYPEAEQVYLEARQVQQKLFGKENIDYARSCSNLAFVYFHLQQYEKAESLFLETKKIRERVPGRESTDYATTCNSLGILYTNMGQFEKAEPFYLEALHIREKLLGKQNQDYVASCINLGILYIQMGQYSNALPFFVDAKNIREKLTGNTSIDYAAACDFVALTFKLSGQYEKAEPLYLEAIQIKEKILGKETLEYTGSANDLANLYIAMGQYEKAEPICIETKQMREKLAGPESLEYAASCNSLALLYTYLGQYSKAESLRIEERQILEKVEGTDTPDYGSSSNDLANLYKDMKQYARAESLYHEAMLIQEKIAGKQNPDFAGYCVGLANLYFEMGAYKKAEPLYLESKQIRQKVLGKQHPYYASSCNNLAVLYQEMGQYQKAKLLYLEAKAVEAIVVGKKHPDYGMSCSNLANLFWLLHQPLEADKEFKEFFSVNNYNLFSIFQFTSETEKSAYLKNILGEDNKMYSFYLAGNISSSLPYSLSLFHRNLILSASQDLQKQLFYSNDSTLKNKYAQWVDFKKNLSTLYLNPLNDKKNEIAAITEDAGRLEKELIRLSARFKQQQQKTGWKEIQEKLNVDEAAIEFASFDYFNGKRYTDSIFYVAIMLRKGYQAPMTKFLFTEKQLSEFASNASDKISGNNINQLYLPGNNSGKSLYNLVWKPLENSLNGVKTIYFAPAGLLHRISFAALPVSKTEVLSDRYDLVQLTTTASVTGQKPSFLSAADNLLLYGGIQYDADTTNLKKAAHVYAVNLNADKSKSIPRNLTRSGSFNYLPGTEAEIESIEEQAKEKKFAVSLLSGVKATEESFKALNGEGSPAVIHIATHGFFFPDPKEDWKDDFQRGFKTSGNAFRQSDNPMFRSGLIFSGGNHAWQGKPIEYMEDEILTAFEVSNMYLPNTKLVVLSACETALGDIQGSEGVYGLQRAFKIAGVQNLVMSLWKVPDTETAEFMQLFYKNLFAQQTVTTAFYNAQNSMKNKYRAEPYKWAAWVLVI